MQSNVWTCEIMRTSNGRLAIELPDDLATMIGVSEDRTVEIAKARNKQFDLWLSLRPEEKIRPGALAERLAKLTNRGT